MINIIKLIIVDYWVGHSGQKETIHTNGSALQNPSGHGVLSLKKGQYERINSKINQYIILCVISVKINLCNYTRF